jgi:hypothetical protein
MDNQNFVNFKRIRGLGDMLSDTFKFLSLEWQPFFTTIVKIAIVPVLIAICAAIYFVMSSASFYGDVLQLNEYESDFNFNFSGIFLPLLLFVFCYLVAYALVTVASLSYIKSYIKNRGVVNYQEIQDDTKEQFWPYVGLFFLVGIIVGFGLLFCFLPGIYFGVVLSLSICLLIFQNTGVLDAISDSFTFIKDHWWETFGILIVVQILIVIVTFVVDLPASIYLGGDFASILQNQEATDVLTIFTDPIYLLLVGLSYLVKFILYVISTIVAVFIYFDIKEQKNPTSDDFIDEIGMG